MIYLDGGNPECYIDTLPMITMAAIKQRKVARNKAPKHANNGSKKYTASVYTDSKDNLLPPQLVQPIQNLEKLIGKKIFMVIQNGNGESPCGALDESLVRIMRKEIKNIPSDFALLIDSPGGQARDAYWLSLLFWRINKEYLALVPRYAKSAATLTVLGAGQIILGSSGELGPLDAWYWDTEKEERISALEMVQSLDRLLAFSMESIAATMNMLRFSSRKKFSTLLPLSLEYASRLVKPLFEQVDVVHYTQASRVLKISEEYAERLLGNRYPPEKASSIAQVLTERYPEHGFVIDIKEAKRIDPDLAIEAPPDRDAIMERIAEYLDDYKIIVIGTIREIK